MKIIIVTAHADDLEIGMGGTAALLAKAGHELMSVIVTLPTTGQVRMEESRKSHQVLGLPSPKFLGMTDGHLMMNTRVAHSALGDLFKDFSPDAVFTHWPADVHPDHRTTSVLMQDFCLQYGVNIELLCFEVCSAGRSSPLIRPQTLGFVPTNYCDLDKEMLALKKKAVDCHASQDPPGMWVGALSIMKTRGREAKTIHHYAEAFVRLTRCGDLHKDLGRVLMGTCLALPRGIAADFSPEAIGITLKKGA